MMSDDKVEAGCIMNANRMVENPLLQQEIDRAVKRGEKRGCATCRVSLASGPLPNLLGIRAGGVVAVCQKCVAKLNGDIITEIKWLTEPIWTVRDDQWFEKHPERQYRLRHPIGQELAAMALELSANQRFPEGVVILVWDNKNGNRLRATVEQVPGPLSSFTDDEIANRFKDTFTKSPDEHLRGDEYAACKKAILQSVPDLEESYYRPSK
jgi:hypothetical protein